MYIIFLYYTHSQTFIVWNVKYSGVGADADASEAHLGGVADATLYLYIYAHV